MATEYNHPGIDPGKLRHKITLLEPSAVNDASGVTIVYAPGSVSEWAEIEYTRGSEVFKAGQDITQLYARITIRYNEAFTATKRLQVPSGRQFVIQSVENLQERNILMALNCQALN